MTQSSTRSLQSPNHGRTVLHAVGLALAVSGAGAAVAQPSSGRASMAPLDEITVTARKREENLQDVPMSISVLSLAQIERQNITSVADIARYTPGLTWSEGLSPLDAKPAIRGQSSPRAASQPAVSVFVDGHLVPWRSGLNLQTIAVERIEVAKGPQSALFGRGVLSGAVNYVTRRPGAEPGGWIEASYGRRDRKEVAGWLDLPVNDQLAFGVSGRWLDFSDGYYQNTLTGRDGVGSQESRAGALSMLYDAGGVFSAYLRASYSTEENGQPSYHQQPSNTTIGNGIWFVGKVPTDTSLIAHNCDRCAGFESDVTWLTAELNWNLAGGTLTSLTGYNKTDTFMDIDADYTGLSEANLPVGFLQNNLRNVFDRGMDNISQELRFTSDQDNAVRWLGGVYYYGETVDDLFWSILGTVNNPEDLPATPQENKVSTIAAFAAIEFDLNDRLTAGLELRRQREKGDVDFIFGGQERALSNTWNAWLPRATIDYRLADNAMLYATVARGTKPGGFNTALGAGQAQLPAELLNFDEEKAWSYEVGVKTDWLDQRLTLNAAIYYIDWSSVQVNAQFTPPPPAVGTTGYTANSGAAEVIGGEIDLLWRPIEQLDIRLGYSYSPARVQDSPDTRLNPLMLDLSGKRRLPYSSDHDANLTAVWTQQVTPDWTGFVQTDVSYRSTQYATVAELAETGARTVVDLRAGVSGGAWDASIFVTNLFGDDTPLSVSPFVNPQTFARTFIVFAPPPRMWGARVRYNF